MIYFILGALSYVFDFPALESNPFIKFIGVLVIFWGLTFSQLGGTKTRLKSQNLVLLSVFSSQQLFYLF